MRNKHLHIAKDSQLLKLIRTSVREGLDQSRSRLIILLTLKFIVFFGGAVACYSLLFSELSTSLFILSYTGFGLCTILFAFNFAHDFSHNTVWRGDKWNHYCFVAIYTLVGAHAEAWRERHVNSHHFAPNVKEYDSDLQITSLIRVSPDMPKRWYHRFQIVYAPIAYTTYSLYWIFVKDALIFIHELKSGRMTGKYFSGFFLQKVFYVAYLLVLPLVLAPQAWWLIVVGFLIMHLVQSIFLLLTFFMTHHVESTAYPETTEDGIIQESWLMNQVKSSNDMHPFSELANFILGGFNNHIAHHLFPHIHHVYYPQLNRILYGVLLAHGVRPNQTSYLGGVVSHLKLLNSLGRRG
ncbi:fatty acid desaturase family protein [Sanyastnella coralliicola]|uniref:fatty acid desaturase family protein n=1 Tax=Sanyastnella coralliicola TaxID=3069118 RepID=UPI0027B90783|nr:fatty acid desaturase [Longitalea sp. SCSIO 12813]